MTRRTNEGRTWLMALLVAAVLALAGVGQAQGPSEQTASSRIAEDDLRRWLTALSSDVMGGRAAFSEGYGLAAGYVSAELARLGVEPLGADGTYLQPVTRTSYRVRRNASITIRNRTGTKTFAHGDHVAFPALGGGRQTLEFSGIDFVGYGLPDAARTADAKLEGRFVVFLPGTPAGLDGWPYPRSLSGASGRAEALLAGGAGAAASFAATLPARAVADGSSRNRDAADLVTVRRVDRPRAPAMVGDESFFDFLLAGAPVPFADLRTRASRGEALDAFTLADTRITLEIDYSYQALRAERTHNVVGVVRGSDPQLGDTYVLFGAHLDHVGTALGNQVPGRANVSVAEDAIWNGADDDGSGSSALLAIAKAMAEGPRPRRSALFVWHGGEEEGLLGSEAMADDPVVPLDRIQAVFNIDMIGRNKDDDPREADTVYVVGADRISTDLHNVVVAANEGAARPLTIDYFYNDPGDSESFYTRSDHYSYASRGVPAAFFFTGPHPDYHANTDTVDKILFPKLVRVTELIYAAGFDVANRAEPLRRDHRGPRSGRGFRGLLPVR